MKENKTAVLQIRLEEKEKEEIRQFAAAHDMTVSELVRMALNRVMV